MATSTQTYYCLEPGIINLTRVTPAPGTHPVKTRVKLNNGKIAIYAIAGGALSPSTSAFAIAASGTASAGASAGTAGPWVSMNEITTSAGDYIWMRSSADEIYP